MSWPAFTLEIEFTAGVWTDVSTYLRTGTTKRGKAFSIDKASPGRMSLTLSNNARTFDPEYSANISPGNVRPEKAIRLSVVHAGVTYPVFAGSIDRISQEHTAGNATARLDCVDGLAKLAAGRVGSAFEVTMRNHSPRVWFRLNEQGRGTRVLDRSGNGFFGLFEGVGSAVEATGSLITSDTDPAMRFTASTQYVQIGLATDLPHVAPWSISFVMNVPSAPAPGALAYFLRPNDLNNGLAIYMDSTGKVFAQIKAAGVQTHLVQTVSAYHLGSVSWMVTVVAAAGLPLKLHIWGGQNETATGTVGTGGTLPTGSNHVLGVTPVALSLDEFLVMDYALSAAELADLTLGLRGWNADVPANRIARILDAADWPAGLRDIGTAYDQLLRATGLGSTVLAHLEALAATMIARLFVERDGTLRFITRQQHTSGAYLIPQATLGDAPGEVGYSEVGSYSLDLAAVENVVRRRWNGYATATESVVEVSDAASIVAYKVRAGDEVVSEFLEINSEETLALFRLGRLKNPLSSVENLKLVPVTDAQWAQCLGRELGDRILWKRRPQNLGAAIERDVIVEGIAHAFGPKRWATTLLIDATDAPPVMIWTTDLWGDSWG